MQLTLPPHLKSNFQYCLKLIAPKKRSSLFLLDRAISYTGATSIQEIVAEVGALVGSAREDEVSNGENFLNLRNLGANRTLTLIDRHRFVSGSSGGTAAVDTNSIPFAMIERVDIFTGGDGIPNYILFANGIRPGNERHVLTLKAHYEFAEKFEPYVSVNYSDVATRILSQHSLTVGSQVARDNAFFYLPPF
ncbi:Plug domain-containing protein [Aliikangiella maris]